MRDISGSAGWGNTFSIDVPSGQDHLSVQIRGASSTSVFVRKEVLPDGLEKLNDLNTMACRGEIWKSCKIINPSAGRYYISLFAFNEFDGVSLRVGYDKALNANELHEVTIAVDTDYNFFQLFGDVNDAEDYVAALFSSVIADFSSDIVTILLIGPIALVALLIGPPDHPHHWVCIDPKL